MRPNAFQPTPLAARALRIAVIVVPAAGAFFLASFAAGDGTWAFVLKMMAYAMFPVGAIIAMVWEKHAAAKAH